MDEKKTPASEVKEEGKVEGETKTETSENLDYKAELERNKKRLEQAEYTIEKLRAENKEEFAGMTSDEIRQIVREENVALEKKLSNQTVRNLAYSKASSPEEAELMIWHYGNSIVPSGDLMEDIDNARVLANKKRLTQNIEELKKSVSSKENRGASLGASQKLGETEKVTLTPEEERFAKRYGLTAEEVIKAKSQG